MYESHVTVSAMERDALVEICRSAGLKPVLIDLDTGSGITQMMTAKFHKTDEVSALKEMNRIAGLFPTVIRKKLEKILLQREEFTGGMYEEYHAKFTVPIAGIDDFVQKVTDLGGHSSQNSLKQDAGDGHCYHFVTTRQRDLMKSIVDSLSNFRLINVIRECVIYDDNPAIDRNWSCGECVFKGVDLI